MARADDVREVRTRTQRATPHLALVCVVMTALLLGCEPRGAADPRAYPGSNSEVTLGQALKRHDLAVPEGARDLRYKIADDAVPVKWMDLAFTTNCSTVKKFVDGSGLPEPEEGFLPRSIANEGASFGWQFGSPEHYAGVDQWQGPEDGRALLVRHLRGRDCRVFVFAMGRPKTAT